MPLKIIKKGSRAASEARRFSFSDNSECLEPAGASLPPWLELAGPSPGVQPVIPGRNQDEPVPHTDLAQVEKMAYESGFHQGEKAGMEIAEKKIESLMRRYTDSINEMGKLRAKLYSQVEREAVKLALEVAKKIVHREIQVDREIIQTLVKVALSHVAEKSAVTVHLHPIDYNFLLEHRELLSQEEEGREVELLADKSVERGGCLIQTECGDIDARIEEEFLEVERGFFDNAKR